MTTDPDSAATTDADPTTTGADPSTAGGDGTAVEDPPEWLTLEPGEQLLWVGGPRVRRVLPYAAAGLLAGVAAAVALWLALPPSLPGGHALLVAVPLAVAAPLPLWAYLRLRPTEYAVTTRGLYRRDRILGRSVTAVDYETVQNVGFSRSVAGALFDHGSLTFDTAGGSGDGDDDDGAGPYGTSVSRDRPELSFDHVDGPDRVRSIVDRQLSRRSGGRGRSAGGAVPGSTEQWEEVLAEVRALRRAVESAGRE